MIGQFVAVILAVAALGLNLTYIPIGDTEFKVEEVTEAVQTEVSVLQFTDVDGNVLMDGSKEYIEKVEWTFGQAQDPIHYNPEYYIRVYFTALGQEQFKKATESAVARTAEGANVINIVVNGEIMSSPIVVEPIYADNCIITGDFTKESAEALADAMNNGLK